MFVFVWFVLICFASERRGREGRVGLFFLLDGGMEYGVIDRQTFF